MKRMMLAVLLALFGFAGCSGDTGSFHHTSGTGATVSKKNFRVLRSGVKGESAGFSLLFIPLAKPTVSQAKERMYDQLRKEGISLEGKAVALANTTEDRGGLNLILFGIPKLTLTADVIEYLDEEETKNRQ